MQAVIAKTDKMTVFVQGLLRTFIFLNAFMVTATFRHREVGTEALDPQVLAKLGIWALSFIVCVFLHRVWLRFRFSFSNIFAGFLLGIILVSCLNAPSPGYSFGAVFSVLSVVLLFYVSSVFLDSSEVLSAVIYSFGLIAIASVFCYYFIPTIGRLQILDGIPQIGTRLSGITGSPNTAGFSSACALLLSFHFAKDYSKACGKFFWLMVAANLAVLILSNSRSSLIALVAPLGFYFFLLKGSMRRFSIGMALLSLITFLYVSIDLEVIFSAISRSGDASEITSGTGRTHIWEMAWDLIKARPWTGYGYASADFILPEYRKIIGHVAPHTHNLFLQILFSVGIPGFVFFLLMYVTKLYEAFIRKEHLAMTILVMLLINGLSEPSVFRGVTSISTVMLAIAMTIQEKRDQDENDPSHQQ